MNHEENNNKGKDNNKAYMWQFVKIKHEKQERGNKKITVVPITCIALQVGDKFYLHDLKSIRKTKSNTKNIKILERFDCIPIGASQKQIEYFLDHLRKRQEKFNSLKV